MIESNFINECLEEFKHKKMTLSCVESFTGGLFSGLITSVSGVSSFYQGGICTYSNFVKHKLGVKQKTLDNFTAVSKETCYEMALCGCKYFSTDVCLSFTGNAGPNPSEGKEVGLYYIGICFRDLNGDYQVKTYEFFQENLTREEIRENACIFAFNLLKAI